MRVRGRVLWCHMERRTCSSRFWCPSRARSPHPKIYSSSSISCSPNWVLKVCNIYRLYPLISMSDHEVRIVLYADAQSQSVPICLSNCDVEVCSFLLGEEVGASWYGSVHSALKYGELLKFTIYLFLTGLQFLSTMRKINRQVTSQTEIKSAIKTFTREGKFTN